MTKFTTREIFTDLTQGIGYSILAILCISGIVWGIVRLFSK